MHLAQGGRGDRFPIELGVDRFHRQAQVVLDAGHRQGRIEAGQLVLQLGQLLQQQGRHDVGPSGEGLAGLDEGGPQGGHQVGRFSGPGAGVVRILQAPGQPVEPHPQEIETHRHQGLPQAPQQPLGVAGVDAGDGGRVVLQQPGSFQEVAGAGRPFLHALVHVLVHASRPDGSFASPLLKERQGRYGRGEHLFPALGVRAHRTAPGEHCPD